MRYLLVLLALPLITGCEVFGPAASGDMQGTSEVRVQAESDALVVTNRSGEDLYYFVMGQSIAPVIQWAPIVTDDNRIGRRRTQRIPFEESNMNLDTERVLIFNWWHADAQGTEADSIRVFTIDL
ncbi:MAG: hypothetical protein AAF730_03970 [Bacteroidota bacterium]